MSQANTRGASSIDNAIVSFNEGSQLGKFYFGHQDANIYIPQDGGEYAIIFAGRDVVRNVSTANMAPGVYVLRLINGDNVRTQKMVIK